MLLKKLLIGLIDIYQKFFSSLKIGSCRFYPTCSAYAKLAIEKYGAFRGLFLVVKRILRCHPWQRHQIDNVP